MNRQYNPKSLENIKPHQFKPKWKSGKTKLMRLPIALEEDILTYTRVIDSGVDIDNSPKSDVTTNGLEELIKITEELAKMIKTINIDNDTDEKSDMVGSASRVIECLKAALESRSNARGDSSSSD
ncbi:hypothetical protein AA637_15435 (plasmid) [Cyanobacterium sp. HL-69]|nr:hypothetical protein AA637_15435 [Cyanobacterium sp. HL-69]